MKEEDKPKVTPMEPGEFEFRKAFEETTIRNMRTIVEFSQDTRKLVRELQEERADADPGHRSPVQQAGRHRSRLSNHGRGPAFGPRLSCSDPN